MAGGHHITSAKGNDLDVRQKAVLRVFVSEGAYHVQKTCAICRALDPPIPVSKDALRKWLRSNKANDYIEHLQKSQGIAVQGVRHNVVQELALVAGSNIMDVIEVDDKGRMSIRNLNDLDPAIQRTVKKVRMIFDKTHDCDAVEIEMHDKMSALRTLSKISNAQKVFDDADAMKTGQNFQLAGLQILPPPSKASELVLAMESVEEIDLDLEEELDLTI